MKNSVQKIRYSIFAFSCLLIAFLANNALGQFSYWDPEGFLGTYSTYTNGTLSGVWETVNWARNFSGNLGVPADQGTNVPVAWVEGDAAVFAVGSGATNSGTASSTTAFTVSMTNNHTVAGIFIGSQAPNSGIVTINGSGVMTVPSGLQGFTVINSSDSSQAQLTISNTMTGPAVLTAQGNGQLSLYGTNTFTGGTHLGYSGGSFTGTINFNNAASFGPGAITHSNANGAALVLTGSSAITITNAVLIRQVAAGINIVGNPAGLTFSGPWTLSQNLVLGSGNSAGNLVAISGAMSGGGALTKDHTGILRLSGANTYSGPTTVTNGTLQLGGNGGIPSGNGKNGLNLVGNGTITPVFDVNGFSGTVDGLTGNGTVDNTAGTGTLSVGTSGTNSTFTGTIQNSAGALNITKTGAGTFTMSGSSSYSGATTVNGGTMLLGVNNIIPSASTVIVNTGAILDMNGTSEAIAALSGGGSVINNTQPLIINGALSTTNLNAYSCFFGPISGTVFKGGTHAMSLRQTNFYGLSFTFSGGTLSVGAGPDRLPPTTALSVPASGVFQLDANNQTLASLTGSGKVNLGGGILTITQASTTTFSGVIQNSSLAGSSTALGHGLRGYYYDNPDFSNLKAVRDDATVNFPDLTITNASTALPDAGMTNTLFSIRWLGQVLTTAAGTYSFVTTSDDGQRLWVNGTLLIDDWTSHGATAKTNTIVLAANTRYDLVMEYFEGTGPASTKLAWIPPGDSVPTVIPTDNLFLPGPGSLVKTGAGTLALSATNTYTGLTTVSQGTLDVRKDGGLGKGNVSVADGATLLLELGATNGYINSSADLLLNGTAPKVNLSFTGTNKIHALSYDGGATYKAAGTYGTTASGAAHPDDVRFLGTGLLNVTASPSTNVLTASAAPAVYGSSINFTSTVTGAGATPTGSVTLFDGASAIAVTNLNGSGQAVFSVSDFLVTTSPHSVKAVYGGDTNYVQSSSGTLSQTVTALTISPGVMTVSNKVYDATTSATNNATASATALVGVLAADTNSVNLVGGPASFTTKTAGLNKAATVTGLTLGGSLAGNYNLSPTTASATGNISNKVLTVTGITASNRVYNATTTASLNTSGATLVGVIVIVPAENVTLNTAGATGSFATPGTNNNKTVTVAGLTLSGSDAPNYTVTQPTTTANITQANSAAAVTGSPNPSGVGSSVTFSATLSGVPPGAGIPTGNVTFLTNGVLLSTSAAAGGVATSASTSTLPLGTTTITAQYAGDANFLGTNNTMQQVVQNTVCSQTNRLLSITRNGGNSFTLNLLGTYNAQYSIVAQTNLTQPMNNWQTVAGSANIVTNPSGVWSVTVTNLAPAFYRAKATTVCP